MKAFISLYILLRCNSHAIYFTDVTCRIKLFFFSVFTKLYSHHHNLTLEHSCHLRRNPHTLEVAPLHPPDLGNHECVFFVSIDLPVLNTSCKWNHTIRSLFYFTSVMLSRFVSIQMSFLSVFRQ